MNALVEKIIYVFNLNAMLHFKRSHNILVLATQFIKHELL